LLVAGLVGAGASIFSGLEGSSAAKTASSQEVNQQQQALDFQKQMFSTQQANQAPYLAAGSTSLGQLMSDLQSGKLGPGSLGAVPQFTGSFSAPTLAEAQQTPGYQFTAQQGSKGILQGAGAAGGAISGGTLKALDSFNAGLADSTYNDVFNRALQTYNTGLQGYQAQLQGYQTGANAQQQGFNQLLAPAQLGENATSNINQTGTQVSQNVGNLMSQIGQSEAAGTVGSSNALTAGVSGAASNAAQTAQWSQILKLLNGGTTGGKAVTPTDLSLGANQPINWGTLYGGVPA
jgi:hypothetical protein